MTEMLMRMIHEGSMEMKRLPPKDKAVFYGRTVEEGSYGLSSQDAFADALRRSLREDDSTFIVHVGLPNSGKSTIVGQEISVMKDAFKQSGSRKPIVYLPWGSFALSMIGGDPSRFGNINNLIPEISARHARAARRIMQESGVVGVFEVPGIAGRGEETVHDVVAAGGFVDAVYADEQMRSDRMLFREEVQHTKTVEQFRQLLQRYGITPHAQVDKKLLKYFQQNGATSEGIRKVDEDANVEMAALLRSGVITGIPSYFDASILYDNGDPIVELLRRNLIVRTEVVRNFWNYALGDRYKVSPDKAIVGMNPEDFDKKHLHTDLLTKAAVPVYPGGFIDEDTLRRRERAKIYGDVRNRRKKL